MNPVLAVQLIALIIQEAPQIIEELRILFTKGDPTPEDWEALRVKVQKSYQQYIDEAKGSPPPG